MANDNPTNIKSLVDNAKPPEKNRKPKAKPGGTKTAKTTQGTGEASKKPKASERRGLAGGKLQDPADTARKSKVDTTGQKPPKTAPAANRERYLVDRGRICRPDGDFPKPLCNFHARIIEEVLHDNGEEPETFFSIEGALSDGRALPCIEIPASSFAGLGWVTAKWGAGAIVYAGSAIKDQLRDALQELSADMKQRTVYTHTGWRLLGGEWHYLHGGGAIGTEGNREGVEVCPGQGHMGLYRLPSPPEGAALVEAIRASLRLVELAPDRPELGIYLLAAIYRAPSAEASPIDHGGWLHGSTGNFKSEAAALALAHFGEFNGRSIPANFTDSEGSVERKAHAAKDALIVVDDFKPLGGANDINKLHAKADRIFRGVGNQAGRGTLTMNRKDRAACYARGFVLATGEDLPRGQSLRARLTVIELAKGDIDRDRLSELQKMARGGLFGLAMAGYLQWLAHHMAVIKTSLGELIRSYRDEAIGAGFAGAHSRTASDFASLRAGLHLLLEFAAERGALSPTEVGDFLERAEMALRALMARQADNQAEEDEVRRFFALLQSALSAGRCHVADRLNQGPPANLPHAWGWRAILIPSEDGGTIEQCRPQGQRIGWTDGQTLWLDGEAAFATVQGYAREQGGLFEIGKNTLWKRVHERGLLKANTLEGGKLRKLSVRQRMNGVLTWVYALAVDVFENEKLCS